MVKAAARLWAVELNSMSLLRASTRGCSPKTSSQYSDSDVHELIDELTKVSFKAEGPREELSGSRSLTFKAARTY